MDIKDKEIIISIFVTNFIKDYFEYYYHYKLFNDDRLRFGLCSSNELEKQELIKKEIEQTKDKLYKYPDYELVLSYLRSFDSNSLEYIDDINKRVDIWIKRIVNHFEIYHDIDHNYIDDEIFGLILAQVEYIKDEIYWDFDFETFIEYKHSSDFLKTLLEYCNIIVYSERLNDLRGYLKSAVIDNPISKKTDQQKTSNYKHGFEPKKPSFLDKKTPKKPLLINRQPHQKSNKQPDKETTMKRFRDIKTDYYVFVELLATNEINEVNENIFEFDGVEYSRSDNKDLTEAINKKFEFEKPIKISQYIREYGKGGDKNILDFSDNIIKKIQAYLRNKNITEVKNDNLKLRLETLNTSK